MTVNDHRADDVPHATQTDSADHDPIAIIQRVLGSLAIDLWGTRKLRQLARELRRAEEWQEVRGVDAEFEAFFEIYPRQAAKQQARKFFRRARSRAGSNWPEVRQQIMAKALRAGAHASDDYFVPLPSTWLQGERWMDEDE